MPSEKALSKKKEPSFRSAAVARLANMPVATLRIWEQRYQAVSPTVAASGHRQYSPADLQRLLLLRQLTGQGHAIGSIAGLDPEHLRAVASTSTGAKTGKRMKRARPAAALRLVVVGRALATRLQRLAVARQLAQPAQLLAVFDTLEEAERAPAGTGADVLIWLAPELQADVPAALRRAQDAWRARQVVVVYRFTGAPATSAFTDTGAALLREPPDDDALGAWLGALEASMAESAAPAAPPRATKTEPRLVAGGVALRRYDDAALTAIAGMSPRLACECPRHVAELLMQLSSFEAYSAGCIARSPADAELHAYLQRVAGASRALFESALESVARHEGLRLG